jgi:hypothetical protein
MRCAHVEIPGVGDLDFYDPPDAYRRAHARDWDNGFIKRHPPEAMAGLFQRFGTVRARASWEQITRLSDARLLGVISSSGEGRLSEVVAVVSEDRGVSWQFRSVVARYDPKYHRATDAHWEPPFTYEPDGFCEPSVVCFPEGELLVVMRMGSWHPLYAVRSSDEGRTWSEPTALAARSVQPKLVMLRDGVLALGTGRPRELVDFSLDQGRSWPYRVYLPDSDGAVGAYVGANSHMVEVEPSKLLYVMSCYNRDPTGADAWLREHGHGRVLGCYLEVQRL